MPSIDSIIRRLEKVGAKVVRYTGKWSRSKFDGWTRPNSGTLCPMDGVEIHRIDLQVENEEVRQARCMLSL
ncbi:MAG TPA: hypothetical protein VEF34_06630 [Syntrophobacteraceae bacterium]|nr:hypothetical protein [Syntrophobacteraceae bacterium]